MAIEREVKLGVWAGFELPDLTDAVGALSVVPRPAQTLNAVYYDTADLRLARWGITLRHRSGDRSAWTVKLPEGEDGPALVRRELDFSGTANRMPAPASALVTAFARTAPLVPVARIRTERSGVNLVDGEGAKVAEIVDDEVSVLDEDRVAARFREIEVEANAPASAELLRSVVARLQEAGAGEVDPTPKLVRALGPRATAPAEVQVVALGPKPTAAEVATSAIAASVVRILQHDPGVRIGDDPEDVHQSRVGTRRLRSDLRTFGTVLDQTWVTALREELRWIAGLLGAVRDADVLEERLRRQVDSLGSLSAPSVAPLFRRLAKERDAARTALVAGMNSARYVALLDELVAAATAPPLGSDAHRRAKKIVPSLVAGPWKKLRRQVENLPSEPSSQELHQVRIRAKRARYAAEAVEPLVGKPAASFARAVAGLQTVLGDHHDAVVAEAWLRGAAADTEPAVAGAIEQLIAVQQDDARACRSMWKSAWKKASAKRRRSWL
jgi:CHAD domain-containing protein